MIVKNSKNNSFFSKVANFFNTTKKHDLVGDNFSTSKEVVIPQRVVLEAGDRFCFDDSVDNSNEYSVIKELGKGGFGTVYSIRNSTKKYACKVLDLWKQQPSDWEAMTARFDRGFKAGQVRSPYLVQFLHQGIYKGNPCVLMELCEGGSLSDRMGEFKEEKAFSEFAIKVLKGLQKLHENGIVHRDIKPENILFDKENNPKLTDFDISVFLNKRQTITNWRGYAKEVWGTAVYAPPEQLDPKLAYDKATPSMDMFAFGVTMYELLTDGQYPFGDFEEFEKNPLAFYEKVKEGKYIPLEKHRPNFSPKWTSMINGCLHPDSDQRISNPAIILNHFNEKSSKNTQRKVITNIDSWQLIIKNGEEIGKAYDLTQLLNQKNGEMLTLGRLDIDDPTANDINIQETFSSYISRKHLTMKYLNNQWNIRDGQELENEKWKPSLNGTSTNDLRVSEEQFYSLKENDIIILAGDVTLKLEAKRT